MIYLNKNRSFNTISGSNYLEVNKLIPLSRGIKYLWTFNDSSKQGFVKELIQNNFAVTSSTVFGRSPKNIAGRSHKFNGTSSFARTSRNVNIASNICTVSFWMYWDAYVDNDDLALELSADTNTNANSFIIDPNSGNPSLGKFQVGISKGDSIRYRTESIVRPAAGAWNHYSIIINNSTTNGDIKFYVNGLRATETIDVDTKDAAGNFDVDILYFMCRGGTALFGAGRLNFLMIHNRELNEVEIKDLYRNPGRIFTVPRIRIMPSVSVVGGGSESSNATPTKASVTVLVNSPTLKINRSSIATPSLTSIKVLINTSTASTSVSYSATATPALASVKILIGTATASTSSSSGSTATPSLVRTTILVNSPTVIVSQSRSVSPSTATVRINIFTATASTGAVRNANATPSISTSRFIVNSPTISIKANRLVQPSTARITIIALAATAGTPGVSGLTITILKQSKIEKTIYDKSRIEKFILGESPIE